MRFVIFSLFILTIYNSCVVTMQDCPNVKLKNGRARKTHGILQFHCNKGYTLYGNKITQCTQDGKWESIPVCVRNKCTGIRNIENGEYFALHKGAVIYFWCKSGYQLKGTSLIYCDGNIWSNNSPSCIENGTKPALSCDFDQNNCGWVPDINHDFDWTRYNQNLNMWHIRSGPKYDHTKGVKGNGFYMYVDASKSTSNETARLISPTYATTKTNVCLEFFYHMQHNGNGRLRVHKQYFNTKWNLSQANALFEKTGFQGNGWQRAFLSLGVMEHDYQIIFEGIRGSDPECDIAVDDVTIIENCTLNEDEDITSTTEYEVTETINYMASCSNGCGVNATAQNGCGCDDDCFLTSTCCPDYFSYCVDFTTDEMTSTDYTTEDITTTNEIESTTPKTTLAEIKTTTTKKIIITKATFPTTTVVTKSTISNEIPQIINTGNKTKTNVTHKFIKRITTYVPKTVKKALRTTTRPRVKNKISFGNDSINDINKKVVTIPNDVEILPNIPNDEGIHISIEQKPDKGNKNKSEIKEMDKIKMGEKALQVKTSSNWTLGITLITLGLLTILIVGIIFYKKINVKSYLRRRGMNSRSSESDIRFLTGDEALDFRLALMSDHDN